MTNLNYFDAHAAGGAGDDAERGFFIGRVQVLHLHLHDFHHLFARHFADLFLVRRLGTGGDAGRFLQQNRTRAATW